MPPRDVQIPLFLWIATAIVAHLLAGGGIEQVAGILSDRRDLAFFAAAIQRAVHADLRPVQVAILNDVPEPRRSDDSTPQVSEPPKPEPPKPEPPKPEPPKPEPPKPEPPKPEKHELPDATKKAPSELKIVHRRAIAVRQHVQDPNQPDNPNAEFLGDQANHVEEQTQARITSTDQDDPNPTPGTSHAGPPDEPGNADSTRVASATGEKDDGEVEPAPPTRGMASPRLNRVAQRSPAGPTPPGAPKREELPEPPQPASESKDQPSAQLIPGQGSVLSLGPAPTASGKLRRLPPPPNSRRTKGLMGLGSEANTHGINLNLTESDALAIVGQDQLKRDRSRDSARRRSKHIGSWKTVGLERWRSAIENYVPSVKLGNQTALNTAYAPFATYLNSIHNRIHPIFADGFLASLDRLPNGDPMNRPELKTFLEIVLSRTDGSLVRMGVTRSSGVTAFDVGALESVARAAPFGSPPPVIVSPDGNVYLHWEFHRNPIYACSTYFAHPYILKGNPAPAMPPIPAPEPGPMQGREPSATPTGFRPAVRSGPRVQKL